MSECGDLILRIFHSNNLTYSSGMNFETLYEIIQKKNDPESLRIINMVKALITKLNEKFMKRICDSFLESRSGTRERRSKESSQEKVQTKVDVLVKCGKCLLEKEELNRTIETDTSMLSSLPNKSNSFSRIAKPSSENTEKFNGLKPYKTLYQDHNEFSLKCNYIFDKFI